MTFCSPWARRKAQNALTLRQGRVAEAPNPSIREEDLNMRRFNAAHRATLAITLLLLFLGIACSKDAGSGGGGSTPPAGGGSATNPVTKTQVIGIEGGEIVADDGSYKLTIPAFALRFPQEIKITSDATPVGTVGSEYRKVSKAFKFEPHGLFFDVPASFWFKYEQGDLAEGSLQEKLIALHYVHDDSKLERTRTTVNTGLNEATSAMQHFSIANGLTNRIENVIDGTVTNTNPVQNTANDLVFHFAQLADDAARQAEYLANQTLIDAFITKTEQILGFNPLFQAFPGIFPTGTTGGYTVIYNANGAESGTSPSDSTIYPTGNNATVLGNTGSMARAYHTFAGWNTAADGSGTLYVAGASLAIASANVVLHAQWVEDAKYTITYHANTSTGGTVPIDAGQYYAGMSVIVSANTGGLSKASSTFLGWNTQADGNGTDAFPLAPLNMPAQNVQLYAKWGSQFTKLYGVAGAELRAGYMKRDLAGNLYVTANTTSGYCGEPINGIQDIILIKLNSQGTIQWCRLLGAAGSQNMVSRLALDDSGNIYLAGIATAGLNGQAKQGLMDGFLAKYASNGDLQWARQFGSTGAHTLAWDALVLPNGRIRVVGQSNGNIGSTTPIGSGDGFISDYDGDGTLLNTLRIGEVGKNNIVYSAVSDENGNVCLVGKTNTSLHGEALIGRQDSFTMRFDAANNRLWTRLAGAVDSDTTTLNVAADASGNCYTFGHIYTTLDGGNVVNWNDYVLIKYSPTGNLLWSRQSNTRNTTGHYVHVSAQGDIFISGASRANLDDQILNGLTDAYFSKFDSSGTRQYTRFFGVAGANTEAGGFVSDGAGSFYVAGTTNGNLDGQTLPGVKSMFLSTKFSDAAPPVNAVTYTGNGNTSGTVPVDANTYIHGATVTAKPRTANFRRDNFAFAGWNTQSDGLGNTRLPGKQFSMGPSAETLYGKWQSKWTRLLGQSGKDVYSVAVAASADGHIYSLNHAPYGFLSELPVDRGGFYIQKRDSAANLIWSRPGYTDGNQTYGRSLVVDSQGRIMVAGITNGSVSGSNQIGHVDGFVAIYSPAGTLTQIIRLGVAGGYTYAERIKTDVQDNIYIMGTANQKLDGSGATGVTGTFVRKYTKDGVVLWTRYIDGGGNSVAGRDLDVSGLSVFVVGYLNTANYTYTGFIARIATSTGASVWLRTFASGSTTIYSGVARGGCTRTFVGGLTNGEIYTSRYVKNTARRYLAFVTSYDDAGNAHMSTNTELPLPVGLIVESEGDAYPIAIQCKDNRPTALLQLSGSAYWVSGLYGAQTSPGPTFAMLFSPNNSVNDNRFVTHGAPGVAFGPSTLTASPLGVWFVGGTTRGSIDGQALTGTGDSFVTNHLGW
jgi:hypothetical protein